MFREASVAATPRARRAQLDAAAARAERTSQLLSTSQIDQLLHTDRTHSVDPTTDHTLN